MELRFSGANPWKQYNAIFREEIQTDGCLFLSLASIAEEAAGIPFEDPEEIERAYQYAMPNYMRDGGASHKNRCYINSHEDVLRVFLHVLGIRKPAACEYLYRFDYETAFYAVGSSSTKWRCTHYVKKVSYGVGGSHFLRCTVDGESLYNPGQTDGEPLSLRGYRVVI